MLIFITLATTKTHNGEKQCTQNQANVYTDAAARAAPTRPFQGFKYKQKYEHKVYEATKLNARHTVSLMLMRTNE